MIRSLLFSQSHLSRTIANKTKLNKLQAVISNRAVNLRTTERSFYTAIKMSTPDTAEYECLVEKVKGKILSYPDFPKKGILFWDIFSAIRDGPTCTILHKIIVQTIRCQFPDVQAVVGLEARGFLFAFAVAQELGIGCLPIRKKGKLPGELISSKYQLEYGSDTFQMQKDSVTPGLKCLILDDLLATGGSCGAAITLLQSSGAKVAGVMVVIELTALKGRKALPCDIKLHSIIQYD